uniref:NADH-ubiquinone oxidoreductase chain 2 n=1 Tax=Hemitheconyx taylori TaxID=449390 RepID=A9ZP00_9SAUR|nr:NADH dehydrogenase subunit 2 [Hemitheconyx taylori]
MAPTSWALLLTGLLTGTMITLSSHHWLLAWMGLEFNTLAMIPIIAKQRHPRATEATIKYFLTQAAASALIMFASTLNAWATGQWTIPELQSEPAVLMLTLALSMKLGLAPVHFWMPEVMQGATTSTALLLTTWQKITPITLLCLTTNHLSTPMLLILGLLSVTIGGFTGLNQTQTRKIMAYFSIAHMGWLLLALTISPNLALMTTALYLIMTSAVFITLITTSTKTITDLGPTWTNSPVMTTFSMFSLLSLGGLPPLSGFLPKWLILKEMILLDLKTISMIMVLASLPSLFFYLHFTYLLTMAIPPTTQTILHTWQWKPNMLMTTTKSLVTSSMLLPILPQLFNIT